MNLRELLHELGIRFWEHTESSLVSRGWVGVVCSDCGKPGSPGRGINLRTLHTNCWKCGGARLGDVLAAASGRALREIIPLLPDAERHSTPQNDERASKRQFVPPTGVMPLNAPQAAQHRNYLRKRHFCPKLLAEKYRIGAIGPHGRHKWRLFVPVFRGEVYLSWTTRSIGEIQPRYLSAPPECEREPIHDCLYGEDFCKSRVVIVEGLFDALRIGDGAVATFGLSFTRAQVLRLSCYVERTVCFDNEAGAQRRAQMLADSLGSFDGITNVVSLSGADPDASPDEEIAELRGRFLD